MRFSSVAAHDFADEPLLRLVPTLGVQGQASATTNTTFTNRWNDESAQATLTWTIFDQGVRYADKHSRDAKANIADLNLELLGRTVNAQVRSALALLSATRSLITAARSSGRLQRSRASSTGM